jgi:hypothetical protein
VRNCIGYDWKYGIDISGRYGNQFPNNGKAQNFSEEGVAGIGIAYFPGDSVVKKCFTTYNGDLMGKEWFFVGLIVIMND